MKNAVIKVQAKSFMDCSIHHVTVPGSFKWRIYNNFQAFALQISNVLHGVRMKYMGTPVMHHFNIQLNYILVGFRSNHVDFRIQCPFTLMLSYYGLIIYILLHVGARFGSCQEVQKYRVYKNWYMRFVILIFHVFEQSQSLFLILLLSPFIPSCCIFISEKYFMLFNARPFTIQTFFYLKRFAKILFSSHLHFYKL